METIQDAAKREIKEEGGVDVELTGVCQIGNRKIENDVFVSVIFTTKLVGGEINYDKDEIMDVRWFSYDEILAMKNEIRNPILMIGAKNNIRKGIVAPLELVELYE